ncbi:hypothetical protein HER32_14105 [Hymenobacter sp. BT18]|uniref:glutamate--tRNA ligase family protein n=1 Tax=Hymenobacter sp. BT18 TaxID=2835648 RepID=UPI00143EF219|nr:glutamate--tRNA ligase family protein [Hymenobacter sp. BT18]QIX62251.1 hypothetical protein HER32_14105 [Hymenobacter sp. BT18]
MLSPLPASVVSRLAPTPSGFLHLGNAVNFTLTWLLVRQAGGTLHLRIDDLDRARVRPQYLENIFRTIDWLGLDYDFGPTGPDDFEQNYSQRHYLSDYAAGLQVVSAANPAMVYACRCSRTELARTSLDGIYPGTCRDNQVENDAAEVAWRVRVPEEALVCFEDLWQGPVQVALDRELGDFVIRKKDGWPAYQLASIIDDVRLGVTLIVRGLDLLPSTAAQLWLAQYLPGMEAFRRVQFGHHTLVSGADGAKLSKSTQASSQRGVMAEAGGPVVVYRVVAQLLGLPVAAASSLASLQAALGTARNA